MSREITIPPEALEAGADIVRSYRKAGVTSDKIARAAFLAMLKAWPGMFEEYMNDKDGDGASLCVILPLEASDE